MINLNRREELNNSLYELLENEVGLVFYLHNSPGGGTEFTLTLPGQ